LFDGPAPPQEGGARISSSGSKQARRETGRAALSSSILDPRDHGDVVVRFFTEGAGARRRIVAI
jgi:hypothetical protein